MVTEAAGPVVAVWDKDVFGAFGAARSVAASETKTEVESNAVA
jgi:hypothetical protein